MPLGNGQVPEQRGMIQRASMADGAELGLQRRFAGDSRSLRHRVLLDRAMASGSGMALLPLSGELQNHRAGKDLPLRIDVNHA